MKKIKAAFLVFGVVIFLSTMTINSARFNYYFVDPAHISGTDPRPSPGTISGVTKNAPAQPGTNGLCRYFGALASAGVFNLAAF